MKTTTDSHPPRRSRTTALAAASAAALAAAVAPGNAQDGFGASPAANFSTAGAVALDFYAPAGEVLELQGSTDLRTWVAVGDATFGEGAGLRRFLAAPGGTPAMPFFRITSRPVEPFGFAPVTLAAAQLVFHEDGGAHSITFGASGATATARGALGTRDVQCVYRKLGDTRARLVVFESGAGSDTSCEVDLEFRADHVGEFVRRESSGGRVRDVESGTFALAPAAAPAGAPDSLVGLTFALSTGLGCERFDFVTATRGRWVEGIETGTFKYSYRGGDDATRDVTVDYDDGRVATLELRFADASGGTFRRHQSPFDAGAPRSDGTFSCAASVYHHPDAASVEATLPEPDLGGATYTIKDGGTPCRLEFGAHGRGRCVEGSHVAEFAYQYAVRCGATAELVLHFADGDHDRYHLNFPDCTFVRDEVRGGEWVDADTGTFAASP